MAYIQTYSTHEYLHFAIFDNFEELPFDLNTLRRHLERLAVASAPFQIFCSDAGRIYRWENPMRTAKWMVTYFFFWYMSHIMTFFYGYTFYCVLMNYFYPSSINDIREGMERSLKAGTTALKIGELMDRHGENDWLTPLLDELGPYLQLQILDLTSFLEILYNFYHFCSPRDTFATLFLFAALVIITAFGDYKFTMKIFWLVLGLTFFVFWPISSLHPRYRLLISPFRWGFWNIPNHAERSFRYLQKRSDVVWEDVHEQECGGEISDDDSTSTSSFETAQTYQHSDIDGDVISFACTLEHVPGHLLLSRTSLCFKPISPTISSVLSPFTLDHPYTSLLEMSKFKTRSSLLPKIPKLGLVPDKIELTIREESLIEASVIGAQDRVSVVLLENMKERDKALNNLITLSGLRWQHLQKKASGKKVG